MAATELPALRDIHLPDQPSWWPPAPGWWLLALLLLVALFFAARALRRHWQRRRRHRVILAEWQRLGAAPDDAAALPAWLAKVSQFLRRLGLAVRPDSAALQGAAWIGFLDRYGDGFADFAAALTDAPYRPLAVGVDAPRLRALVQAHLQRVLRSELRDV